MHYVLDNLKTLQKVSSGSTTGLGSTLMVNLSRDRTSLNDYSIECALEMVVHIHRIHEINAGLQKIGISDIIEVEIYHRMLQYILEPSKPLSKNERIRLFTEQQKIWDLSFDMRALDMDSLPLAKEIEIMSFGIHSMERELLEKENFWRELVDNFFLCHNLLSSRNIKIKKFDEMFETVVESTRKGYAKEMAMKEKTAA